MKNSVMNAKIDPKVVMELSMFKVGGWKDLQPSCGDFMVVVRQFVKHSCLS